MLDTKPGSQIYIYEHAPHQRLSVIPEVTTGRLSVKAATKGKEKMIIQSKALERATQKCNELEALMHIFN